MQAKILVFTVFSLVVIPALALCDTKGGSEQAFGSECVSLLKDCFAQSDQERTQCFYNAANNGFCQGTQLGRMAFKRWVMSPNTTSDESSLGFLGPQFVDQECLKNFDNAWSSELIKGSSSTDTYSRLEGRLDECRTKPANEMLHP